MPIQVTAYSCAYGCHRKVLTSKKAMANHEKRCFHNPAQRACITCGNFGHTVETVYNPHHNGDPGSTDYEEEKEYCEEDLLERDEMGICKLRANCEKWKAKA